MIKYIGSKRRLVPTLGSLVKRSKAKTALDMFTGTTRVAQELKRNNCDVTTLDTATYSEVIAKCYIETDKSEVDEVALKYEIARLNALTGIPGYVTENFCEKARFFQPKNGARIDAIRDEIEKVHRGKPYYYILLTSLMEAADRVDSTTGVQMAYVKKWAPRSFNDLELRLPDLITGKGTVVRGDAVKVVPSLERFDVAYLDPPYNQHRYFTNYHIWETLVRWDDPEPYGIAMKRIDSREDETKSVFNKKREMPDALRAVVESVSANLVILSYNDESWVDCKDLCEMMSCHGFVKALAFESTRYVGAKIGIHNPKGEKVGNVGRLRNKELVILSGDKNTVESISEGFEEVQIEDDHLA